MNDVDGLKEYYSEIIRLKYIRSLLGWDQQVCMPKGAIKGRAEQTALIQKLIHSKVKSNKTKKLIQAAEKSQNLSDIDKALIRETRREYEQAIRIPDELVMKISKTSSIGHVKWEEAREKSDFSIFKPCLEKMITLQIEFAEKLDTGPTPYSTLIDLYEPGATYEWIAKVFNQLKPKLLTVVKKLNQSKDKPSDDILRKNYASDKQWKLSIEVIKKLNFDFEVARQDKSTHPFTTSISSIDTRITTRINENFLSTCLFGTIHECGHALYQMNFDKNLYDTLLANGASMGIHESQSRLWENLVGRSNEFWTYWYPKYQEMFPENLKDYPLEEFYRSINVVEPSLIRVEADEVTYALHIMLRFELEKKIIEDSLDINILPEMWNDQMEKLLGVIPTNDTEGILQDIHWSGGGFGYFPSYALGNLYAAQIYTKILGEHPKLPEEYEKGEYINLLKYLQENVYQHGAVHYARELIKKISGEDLNPDYFIKYIKDKFYPIYGI